MTISILQTCNRCGKERPLILDPAFGDVERISIIAERRNWKIIAANKHLCSDCLVEIIKF